LLAGLVGSFVLLCGYNAYAGLRYDSRPSEVLIDSVEELGIGLVLSVAILALLGRISVASVLDEGLGTVVIEGLLIAIGVSVGTAQLAGGEEDQGTRHSRQPTLTSEIILALCGAILIVANVAPTDEVLVLAAGMSVWQLLGTMAISVVLAATLLYFSDFAGSGRFDHSRGHVHVLHGAALTYAAALVCSAAILWFFGRFQNHALEIALAQCVILALPGTLGASAGRLLLK